MYNERFEEDILSIRDSVHGIVTGQNRDGNLYIVLFSTLNDVPFFTLNGAVSA